MFNMKKKEKKSEIKNIITIGHEFQNFPILRILTMIIKHICTKLNIRLEKRKKNKNACYNSNLCKKK